jgi:heptosyltransferase-2
VTHAAREQAVVRLPSWLGDAVMAEPVVRAVSARYDTTLVAPARVCELWSASGAGLRCVALAPGERETPRAYVGAALALVLNGSWRGALCAARARVPVRAGFARGARRLLFTSALGPALERGGAPPGIGRTGAWPRVLPRPFGAACVELAGLAGVSVEQRAPRLATDERVLARARARLVARGVDAPFWLVHAGARPDSAKGFPALAWVRLVRELARLDTAPIVLCCAPGEEGSARAVARELPRAVLLDDPAPGVAELVALSFLARAAITPDNGARHVAQAAGKPVLVLCGPTDPRHTAEHSGATRVLRVEVDCGPCHRERCPLSGAAHHACMRAIDPEAAALAAVQLARAHAASTETLSV